nr:unnamed protein product [Callosobruchus chinensis]
MDAYLRETEYEQVHTLEVFDLEKKLYEFKILLNQLNCEYDCIVFTGTFKIPDTSVFQLSGYSMIYNDKDNNKNDGSEDMFLNDLEQYLNQTKQVNAFAQILG